MTYVDARMSGQPSSDGVYIKTSSRGALWDCTTTTDARVIDVTVCISPDVVVDCRDHALRGMHYDAWFRWW